MSVKSRALQNKQEAQWEWNIPLFIRSLCIAGGLGVAAAALYFWQSSSMASELLAQANSSQERGEIKEKVKWLSRYVRLVPSDVESLANLAFAVDSQETGPSQNVELARSRLSNALVACGDDPQHAELRKELRRNLIPRLLQYGAGRAQETEQQIVLLAADENDAEVLNWLAQSLLMQRTGTEYQARDAGQYDKGSDYWKWLAAQPTGEVVHLAVEANPDDVQLASNLLSVCIQRPIWFGTDSDAMPKEKIEELAKQTLERLSRRTDDGHAQFVVYLNTAISNREKANSILESALEPAMRRLSEFLGVSKNQQNEFEQPSKEYTPFWDWQIALERCRIAGGDEAENICKRLIQLANQGVAEKQREDAFVRLASLRIEKGEFENAIEICQSGLTSIQSSMALNRLIAFANLRLGRTEAASKAIKEIEDDTELRLKEVDSAGGVGKSSAEKAEIRQQLAAEQWTASLLKGQLAVVEKDYSTAMRILRDAYKTTMSISAESRVEAGLLLASCYSQNDQWDLAGQVYDECSILKPNAKLISINAVRAWSRAGSSERANEKIGNLDDTSYVEALERAALIASKPTSPVERRALLASIKIARARLDAIPVEERTSLEPWRLELLELRFGSENVKTPNAQESESLSKLEAIAERYAEVGEVQVQAALDLAAFGRTESSNLAIRRLEQIAERSKKLDDRVSLVLAKTGILVGKKDTEGALQILESAIKAMPDQTLRFAKVAAKIEIRADRIDKAYSVLSSVPEENVDFEAVTMLVGIVDILKASDASKADELNDKLDRWIGRIKEAEGKDGTNWRYLTADRLIAKSVAETNARQPLLEQASQHYKEIDALRPHWGLASALGAKIASIKAQIDRKTTTSEEAIALWRRAIRDGDNRVSTVLDLVRELNLLNRSEQAEAEMRRISSLADSVVPISAWAVSFAIKRHDFSEALVRAEQLTNSKPDDVDGWLLRAQTALAASSELGLEEKQQVELRDAAWSFLEKAHSLSLGKKINVWDARFRFKLLAGDKVAASALIDEMLKEASLAEEVRFMEAGRRYLILKEYGLARKCFDNCLLINPRSAEVYLGIADLNTEIGDTEESLNSLRKAHQLVPKNQAIRDRLAINLAFSRNDKNEKVDWKEIDALLTSSALQTTPRSILVGALIALSRGDEDRQNKAAKTLKEIAQSSNPERNDAKRLLANYYAFQWSTKAKNDPSALVTENFESAKQLYEFLLDEDTINPNDAVRYVSLCLSFDAKAKETNFKTDVDYLSIAKSALSKLKSATGSSIASLQLDIRLAKASGEEAAIGSIAEKWVQGAGDLESLGKQKLWEIAGQTLLELGHAEEAVTWFEKVNEKDPTKYAFLVIALARSKKYDRAIELCVNAYRSEPTPIAATLVAEVAMMHTDVKLTEDASQVLKEALAKFADSAELLEAMGTLQLMKRSLLEAVWFYESAEKIDPTRRRTLNNLSMALSEIPMRKQEALAKIEKAIEIHGRDPDLLDTLGQVQFRNGRLLDALDSLKEACGRKDDVSFRIHLTQVLMEKKDLAGAKEQWTKIKQSESDDVVLTLEDKKFLADLNSQFSEKL